MDNSPQRAADSVVQAIEKDILAGSLGVGQPLPPERDLIKDFGVSRTVVREAVRILSSRGLVEARPRHRPIVRKPGFDAAADAVSSVVTQLLGAPGGVRNLFDTRILIEAALVRQAAVAAKKDDIIALGDALWANEAAIADSALFYQTDMAFHGVLYGIPDNPVLPAIHKTYTTWLSPHWARMQRLPERNRTNFTAHRAIYDAILQRDPDGAEVALRAHLDDAWQQVRATFGDS